MSKGMYYKDLDDVTPLCEKDKYCGTFYYHEPESSTFLAYKTSRIFFNKTVAVGALGVERGKHYGSLKIIDKNVGMHIDGTLPEDLNLTPVQYAKMLCTAGKELGIDARSVFSIRL